MRGRIRKFLRQRLDKKLNNTKPPTNARSLSSSFPSPESSATASSESASSSGSSPPNTQPTEYSGRKDLWQTAYDQLDKTQQRALSAVGVAAQPNGFANGYGYRSSTRQLLDGIIQTTREEYEEYQAGGWKIRLKGEDIHVRNVSEKIINAALSVKDIISTVVAFDPTCHAHCAWAIVSLGLTVAKNYYDLRDALFSSSEYLADVLARCACIENNFYHEHSHIKYELENAIVRTYRAILQYAAEVWTAQNASTGKRVLNVVTTITEQPLTDLKSCVVEQQQYLHQWVEIGQYLERRDDARNMLASLQNLMDESVLAKLPSLDDAAFDSYVDQDKSECLDGTRADLLGEVEDWGSSPDSQCIFWLNGMAGTGKSTISRTVSARFRDKGMLGASFFFKRGGGDRGNAKQLFTTITRQLVTGVPQMMPSIKRAVDNDPGIAAKSLNEQFKKLILQPLLDLDQSNRHKCPIVVVIDALDECERESDIRIILQLLPQVTEAKSIGLRFFLTSRPELPTKLGFRKVENKDRRDLVLHEIPRPIIEHDITLFLKHKFATIREDRLLFSDWPGDDKIQALVEISIPLFIFAATVCRFVEDLAWSPEERLEDFLRDPATTSASEMDRTYLPILNQLTAGRRQAESKRLLQEFHDIIGAIILLATPLSVTALTKLINVQQGVIRNRLESFNSVLSVPNDPNVPVRILHLSFRDFLVNTTSDFHVDEADTHSKIGAQCLRIMNGFLRHNICDLPSYGIERTDIENETIDQCLPEELKYSCRYWAYHLQQGRDHINGTDDILLFLERHLLHWFEAMSLMGILSETISTLNTLQSAIKDKATPEISDFLHDAKRFILRNMHIADIVPLQLYCSGLVFAPKMSIVRDKFENEIPKCISIRPKNEDSWSADLQTLEGHSSLVTSVAFSPDNSLIASGSDDNTVRLWDAAAGVLQHILHHSDNVKSVVFSPDSSLVASGSQDHTVGLWDTTTGVLQHVLCHPGPILEAIFSPDSSMVASNCEDHEIRLWDTTGTMLHVLEDHSDSIHSLAFSPDSSLIASGSDDSTARIWDTATGSLQHIVEGHAIAFSPNGRLVVSGSHDDAVRLWDVRTGTLKQTLEPEHSEIKSVMFSPNGCLIASSSYDDSIKLWDAATGAPRQILIHTHWVQSAVFSPDSSMVASCSHDSIVWLWDAATGALLQTFEGHSFYEPVTSVAFSPDSSIVASGSEDKTIRLWDATTGDLKQQTNEFHSQSVTSIRFSPADSSLAVSGSNDNTVKLWDATTGTLQQTLDPGHSDSMNSVQSVIFSPNGCLVASGSTDGIVRVWHTSTKALQHTLEGHSSLITSVEFSPDSCLVASASHDNTVRVWNAMTGVIQHVLEGHSDVVKSIAFSPNGCLVASGSYDRTVRLWNTATGALQHILEGHSSPIWSISYTMDSAMVIPLCQDNTGCVWDTATGSLQDTIYNDVSVSGPLSSEPVPDHESLDSNPDPSAGHVSTWSECTTTPAGINHRVPSIQGEWITLDDEKVLWLPVENRYLANATKQDRNLAFGHESGRVSFIGFCTD